MNHLTKMPVFRRSTSANTSIDPALADTHPPAQQHTHHHAATISEGSSSHSSHTATQQRKGSDRGPGGSPSSTFSRFGLSRHHSRSVHESEGLLPEPALAVYDVAPSLGPEVLTPAASKAVADSAAGSGSVEPELVSRDDDTTPRPGLGSPTSHLASHPAEPFPPYSSRGASPTRVDRGDRSGSRSPRLNRRASSARAETAEGSERRRDLSKGKGKEDSEGEEDIAVVEGRRRVSPLVKRLGEEPPFMLPHPSRADATYQTYPGVVIGSFAGGGGSSGIHFGDDLAFDGTMDDILDPSARPSGRGSTGQAGANIAPWLQDDGPAPTPVRHTSPAPAPLTPTETPHPPLPKGPAATLREKDSRKASASVLNHFSSVPSLPKIRRTGTGDTYAGETSTAPGSRNGSQPTIVPPPGTASSASSFTDGRQSRAGSGDSLQTLNDRKGRRGSPGGDTASGIPPPPRSGSTVTGRAGRFGSTTSSVSAASSTDGKKKGFLGGFLRKKTGPNLTLNPIHPSDFAPSDGSHRGSNASVPGSASSRMSSSASFNSLNQRSPPSATTDRSVSDPFSRTAAFHHGGGNYMPEGMISPLQEISETPFHLDMNLDDMEGIIDPAKAGMAGPSGSGAGAGAGGTVPSPAGPAGPGGLAPTDSVSTAGSVSLQSSALPQTSSFGTSISTGASASSGGQSDTSGSGPGVQPHNGRNVISEAERQSGPFTRTNPFSGSGQSATIDLSNLSPSSPHTLSPKHRAGPSAHPRRPSALRNVKLGSTDSESNEQPDTGLQPIAPAWAAQGASRSGAAQTLFHDPFSSTAHPKTPTADGFSPGAIATPVPSPGLDPAAPPFGAGQGPGGLAGPSALGVLGASTSAAWAAPESWGVEGDDVPSDETSSTDEDGDQWVADDGEASPVSPVSELPSPTAVPTSPTGTGATARRAPPFGHKSQGSASKLRGSGRPGTGGAGRRQKASGGRASTGNKPGTGGRPGTSGSTYTSSALHWVRIYRADGSHQLYQLPLNTNTAEIIGMLSGSDVPGGKKVVTNMKLYVCERGQDRMLLPSERPLSIQHRRLLQMGYTEADHLEEIGKSDMGVLCRFIYQTPLLPTMDPEEESSYDSFEFIDIAGRDLQTIPIFLHLHAHNIIILNASRNPMTDIPLDFIQACTSLKELRMSNMALKRVPISIRASTTLARLDVSCNRIADLESVALNEVETLVSLKVQNNKLTSMPSYFAQMKSLKYLNISNNKFESFPSVVCEMSNLVDLDVSFNNITELPSKMSDLKSLEKLALFSNEITKFPESFSTLANLRILDVRRNKITDLSVVYALPNLATLQADHNNVVTLDAQIGSNVRQFSVPHNSVTRFTLAPPPNMAVVTYMLTSLDLSHGKISTLADEAFSGLVNLVTLNLNFNQFTRLPATLDRLVNLEVFSCTDNLLNTIPDGFGKLQKLRVINLHNNNLRHLPADLWACSSLEIFNASSNLLDGFEAVPPEIEADILRSAAAGEDVRPPAGWNMRKIYLADNHLNDDIFHYLALMPGLRVLNLSFNEIYEIPPDTLCKCAKLEALYLSGNKLTSLPSEDLEKLQSLRTLHLNGNKLQTLPSELGAIKTLQHLDVGSNVLKYNIANWPYDWNWNWNTALRYLNLSGNKRLEIKPTSAQEMTHASSFRKELSDFTALTQLSVLGLMDVTLRIPSLPDESDEKRVRTSFSDINNMAYGIADMLGTIDSLAMFDLVVPNFRGNDNECLFGMFGRATATSGGGKIAKRVQEIFADTLNAQLAKAEDGEEPSESLRRTFLWSDRKTFEYFMGTIKQDKERKSSWTSFASFENMFRGWTPSASSVLRKGASGAVVYLVDKVLHVGSVGDTLVVLSRKGDAELLSKRHDPTDRDEVARIRKAEAWVSTKGFVNDDKDLDISRAFGYWHECVAVNAAPEIRTRVLAESDEFVIIGNHALWKCCSYQTAVDIARTERGDPMMAAQKLRDFAISYGAEGSVMVMVVNVSDLFAGRNGHGLRGHTGSGPAATADVPTDMATQASLVAAKRPARRRYEEVGDRTLNRLQQEIEPPTGQVAIVFTDIVNSTHLWETNPGMPTAIKMHHSLMRRQLRLDGGYEVKTEGDSFMVSFQSVTAAVLWCFNCQILLLQQEWPRELLAAHDGKVVYDSNGTIVQRGLRVRMGVHWGAPECEKDPITRRMDYYGPMVNRAARINASADGGQLMASQDVLNELAWAMEYLETNDEEVLNDLQGDVKREIMELRRIGVKVKDMGERKLKGLEVPEKLHLLYPKTLLGRLEISNELRAEVEVNDVRKSHAHQRMIDIDQVHQLASIVLRLEALCTIAPASPGESSQTGAVVLATPPSYLGPTIREDMSDEELGIIMESLVGRLENTMSTLYFKNLGGFSSVLAALEQATKIDSKLIVHALALMNGAMGQ
ncbi:hypothetical protein IAT38_005780 [Cryptococcus sp. DSM 104549]